MFSYLSTGHGDEKMLFSIKELWNIANEVTEKFAHGEFKLPASSIKAPFKLTTPKDWLNTAIKIKPGGKGYSFFKLGDWVTCCYQKNRYASSLGKISGDCKIEDTFGNLQKRMKEDKTKKDLGRRKTALAREFRGRRLNENDIKQVDTIIDSLAKIRDYECQAYLNNANVLNPYFSSYVDIRQSFDAEQKIEKILYAYTERKTYGKNFDKNSVAQAFQFLKGKAPAEKELTSEYIPLILTVFFVSETGRNKLAFLSTLCLFDLVHDQNETNYSWENMLWSKDGKHPGDHPMACTGSYKKTQKEKKVDEKNSDTLFVKGRDTIRRREGDLFLNWVRFQLGKIFKIASEIIEEPELRKTDSSSETKKLKTMIMALLKYRIENFGIFNSETNIRKFKEKNLSFISGGVVGKRKADSKLESVPKKKTSMGFSASSAP